MSRRSFLFVHSPLVGPSSLRRLAAAASDAEHEVALPDLTAMANAAQPHESYVQLVVEAARSLTSPITVVGHSGAGAFLPRIGNAIDLCNGLIFVDAVVPPTDEPHRTTEDLQVLLDCNVVNGRLEPWIDWWPDEVVGTLLPDPNDRLELRADMPRLPRSFYDQAVDVPAGWSDGQCAYLRLSDAYATEMGEAIARRWPTQELDSTHLGTHTMSDEVLAAILDLVARIGKG